MACQPSNSNSATSNASPQKAPAIQASDPIAKFNGFIDQFPTLKLPYTLSTINTFSRLDEAATEHFLDATTDEKFGISKSVHCIGTFKTNNFIAVVYQWTASPNTENSPTYLEIAVYTPYGSKKSSTILGLNQQTEAFTKEVNLRIHSNFSIEVEQTVFWYVTPENKVTEQYESFYINKYQITKSGDVQRSKSANLWEQIPKEFTTSFVLNHKKDPTKSLVSHQKIDNKTILVDSSLGYQQLIVAPIPLQNLDSSYLVSSLQIEGSPNDSFFIHSTLVFIQFNSSGLNIISDQVMNNANWDELYASIQTTCACEPAPHVNNKGIIGLTMLTTGVKNAVYADLNNKQELVFRCRQNGINSGQIAYPSSLE